MIYLHLSSSSIEAIATKKGLLAKDEKISAVSRKVLSEKPPHQDLLENDQLATTIKELLKSAYPAEIKDNQVSTVLPDNQVIIKRFSLSGKKNTTEEVIYLDINQFLNLVIFDENGPLDTMEKKATPKNINAEIKTLIKKLHEKNNLTANKLIIAGEKSLELSATDLSE